MAGVYARGPAGVAAAAGRTETDAEDITAAKFTRTNTDRHRLTRMPGAFYYSPNVRDERAEILSRAAPVIAGNLSQGMQSLGAAIGQLKQKHDELKAKKALAEAYADQMGVPSENVDKMRLPQLDAFLTLAPAKLKQAQQQQQSSILGRVLQGMYNRQSPETPSGAIGTPPAATANPSTDLYGMLGRAASAGATPDTLSALAGIAKTANAMFGRGMTVDPTTGLRLFNGKLPPVGYQKLPLFGQGAAPPTMQFSTDPKGNEFYILGNRVGQVRTPPAGGIPPAPTMAPAPGYTWIWDGKAWREAKAGDNFDVMGIDDQGNPTGSPANGGKGTGERVMVKDKDGNLFSLPKDQLDEAKKQGYTEEKGTQ